MSRPPEESLRYTHLPWLLFWKVSYPEFVWLPLLSIIGLLATLMAAWGVQCSRPMPWTKQQCSEGNWPVRSRSLLCCLGRPRAAKPAFMARSGVGISRLLPHSQGEWTRCPGCPLSDEPNTASTGWWRWSSRSAWTVSAIMHVLLSDPFTNEFDKHFSWTTSLTSRSVTCW